MTHRANQSLAAAGILAVLIAILAFQLWEGPEEEAEPEPVAEDDDSGDDDSAPFSNLPEIPKE